VNSRLINAFVCGVFVVGVYGALFCEKGVAQRPTHSYKLVPSKASVYIDFVKVGQGADKDERLWLKIHNNQHWGIRLEMSGTAPGEGEANLFYDVLDRYEHISDSISCHVCSTNILSPGKSLTFSIPKDHLVSVYAIRIRYSFAWEDDLNLDEPQDYSYFLSSDLPEKIKTNR
jgi:hypothetical protein